MAEQKAPTREEIDTERKKRITSLESNLASNFYLNLVGANDLRNEASTYGALGESIGKREYSGIMTSSDANDLRKKLYEGQVQEAKNLGIADMPEYTSNYQVIRYAITILNESISGLPLGNLEKALEKVDKGIKLEIPDALKQYEAKRDEAIMNATAEGEEVKPEVLDKESEAAIKGFRERAYTALRRAAAFKLMDAHRYDDINGSSRELGDAYKKAKGIVDPKPEAGGQAE